MSGPGRLCHIDPDIPHLHVTKPKDPPILYQVTSFVNVNVITKLYLNLGYVGT